MPPENGNGIEAFLEVLIEHERQSRQNIGESYAIMNHFAPEVKRHLSEIISTLERSEEGIQKRLQTFDERVDAKISRIYKLCRFFTLKGLICLFASAVIAGIFIGYELSERAYFKEARERRLLQNQADIEIMEYLRKRGVGIYKDVLLAPPRVVKATGTSKGGDQGIWLKD